MQSLKKLKFSEFFFICFNDIDFSNIKESSLQELISKALESLNAPHYQDLNLAMRNYEKALSYSAKAANYYELAGFILYINVSLQCLNTLANTFDETVEVAAIKLYEIVLIAEYLSKFSNGINNDNFLIENIYEKNYWENKKSLVKTLLHLPDSYIQYAQNTIKEFIN